MSQPQSFEETPPRRPPPSVTFIRRQRRLISTSKTSSLKALLPTLSHAKLSLPLQTPALPSAPSHAKPSNSSRPFDSPELPKVKASQHKWCLYWTSKVSHVRPAATLLKRLLRRLFPLLYEKRYRNTLRLTATTVSAVVISRSWDFFFANFGVLWLNCGASHPWDAMGVSLTLVTRSNSVLFVRCRADVR